jgi:hypothetical protein
MKLVKYLFVLGSGIFAHAVLHNNPLLPLLLKRKSSTISHSLHFLTEHL